MLPLSLVVVSSPFMQGDAAMEQIVAASISSASNDSNTSWATNYNVAPQL
jgi:hypothetical protein